MVLWGNRTHRMCTQRETYYSVLAHAIVKAGQSKSAVWAGRPETQENQWRSTSLRQCAGEFFLTLGKVSLFHYSVIQLIR